MKLYVKVDWPEDVPLYRKNHLEKAIQTFFNADHKEKCSVLKLQLLDDKRFAEVEVTPSIGETLRL